MPLVFEPAAADEPYFTKNFSTEILPSLRIARAGTVNFAYYYSVNGLWRWVGLLTGSVMESSGFTESESAAQRTLTDQFETLLSACELTERRGGAASKSRQSRIRQTAEHAFDGVTSTIEHGREARLPAAVDLGGACASRDGVTETQ